MIEEISVVQACHTAGLPAVVQIPGHFQAARKLIYFFELHIFWHGCIISRAAGRMSPRARAECPVIERVGTPGHEPVLVYAPLDGPVKCHHPVIVEKVPSGIRETGPGSGSGSNERIAETQPFIGPALIKFEIVVIILIPRVGWLGPGIARLVLTVKELENDLVPLEAGDYASQYGIIVGHASLSGLLYWSG